MALLQLSWVRPGPWFSTLLPRRGKRGKRGAWRVELDPGPSDNLIIPFSPFFPEPSSLWGWYPGCIGHQEVPISSQAPSSLTIPPSCGCITPRVTRGSQENKYESWQTSLSQILSLPLYCCLSLEVACLLSRCGDSGALHREPGCCCTTACCCFEQCLHSSPLFLSKYCAASAEQANDQKCPVTYWKTGCLVSCCVKLVPQKDNGKLCNRTLLQLATCGAFQHPSEAQVSVFRGWKLLLTVLYSHLE